MVSKITDILDKYDADRTTAPDMHSPTELEQAILDVVNEAIGKDDRDYSHDNADEQSLKILVATSTACNELRAEIRQKLGISIKEQL